MSTRILSAFAFVLTLVVLVTVGCTRAPVTQNTQAPVDPAELPVSAEEPVAVVTAGPVAEIEIAPAPTWDVRSLAYGAAASE